MNIYFRGLDRIALIMDRGGRAGKIIDFVHFDIEREGDVVTEELKIGVLHQMNDISLRSRIKIVHAQDIETPSQKMLTEMGTQETSAPGNQYSDAIFVFHFLSPVEINEC